MDKQEYIEYLKGRAEESDEWIKMLISKGDTTGAQVQSGAAWAFRVARIKAEDDLDG